MCAPFEPFMYQVKLYFILTYILITRPTVLLLTSFAFVTIFLPVLLIL